MKTIAVTKGQMRQHNGRPLHQRFMRIRIPLSKAAEIAYTSSLYTYLTKKTAMNRAKFMLTALAAIPLTAFAKIKSPLFLRTDKGFKISAGEGRIHGHMKLKGVNANVLDVKVSGSDTDSGLAIFEQTSLSPGKGTPLHIHHSQDEIFYVIRGSYYFRVGEEKFTLTKGDSIFLPRQVPHAWTQVSKKGKMTVTVQPAGKLEDFFVAVAALDHEPTKEEMQKIFADNEMEVVGPPLTIDK
jgi:quercetin dioxygenase-like cupin family protein